MKTNLMALCFLLLILWLMLDITKFGNDARVLFTNDNAISAIVGEYAQEDIFGMKLIAHAIRNRGTLKGVYGVNAKHNKTESKRIWQLASLAWFESENEIDPTAGASEWRSEQDIQNHGWPEGFRQTMWYKGTYFLKPTNNKGVTK